MSFLIVFLNCNLDTGWESYGLENTGISRGTGISRATGNSRNSGIPEAQTFPARFPGNGNFPYRNFPPVVSRWTSRDFSGPRLSRSLALSSGNWGIIRYFSIWRWAWCNPCTIHAKPSLFRSNTPLFHCLPNWAKWWMEEFSKATPPRLGPLFSPSLQHHHLIRNKLHPRPSIHQLVKQFTVMNKHFSQSSLRP